MGGVVLVLVGRGGGVLFYIQLSLYDNLDTKSTMEPKIPQKCWSDFVSSLHVHCQKFKVLSVYTVQCSCTVTYFCLKLKLELAGWFYLKHLQYSAKTDIKKIFNRRYIFGYFQCFQL